MCVTARDVSVTKGSLPANGRIAMSCARHHINIPRMTPCPLDGPQEENESALSMAGAQGDILK